MQQTLSLLTPIFRDVFDDDAITLSAETNADDIEGWDSLMHVTLIAKIEHQLGVKFSSAQVALLTDVGELVELIESMRSAGSVASVTRTP